MTTITNIIRPEVTTNFTALPNVILNLCSHGFSPNDQAVLLYLLSKPSDWKIIKKVIATEIGKGIGTVQKSFRRLQDAGFISFDRHPTGHTDFFVSVPENFYKPEISPHVKKPHVEKPHVEKRHDIIKNEIPLQTNKKTTNVVEDFVEKKTAIDYINEPTHITEIAPIGATQNLVEFDINELTPVEKETVKKELKKVEPAAQSAIVSILKTALAKKNIQSPVGYAKALVKTAQAGNLDIQELEKPVIPLTDAEKQMIRETKIRNVFSENGEKIKAQLADIGYITLDGEGTITKSEFEALGLISKKTNTKTVLKPSEIPNSFPEEDEQNYLEIRKTRMRNALDKKIFINHNVQPTEKELAARQKIIELEIQLRERGELVDAQEAKKNAGIF